MKQRKKITSYVVTIMLSVLFFITPVYANVEGSTIFTGLKQLLEDISKAIIILAIPAGTVSVSYCFFRRSAADEMDHKKWTNRIQVAIYSTVGAVVAGAIISVVSGYFK